MFNKRISLRAMAGILLLAGTAAAQAPRVEDVLARQPNQPGIAFTTPTGADLAACKADAVSWPSGAKGVVVKDGSGRTLRQFIDTTGGLWLKGELEDKAAGVFVGTGTIHGGQETTVLTTLIPLLHLGMVFVGTPYGQNPQILTTDGQGGSPYGPGTLAGPDGSRQPSPVELTTANNLGGRVARVAARLKDLRGTKK